ncbi:putative aminotransferase [Amniculicola lignicola CBS 123094]|uniref:Putative aminotransferase n=1 Tax=Amniculicola lignicola CBS 123094 TaxID=1392246 RepID=A0A6A5WD89_9PLEO|nr:putative aminotransferase [Amniculicola lignicola CBS 123094]
MSFSISDDASSMLSAWISSQKRLQGPSMKKAPIFYRNLEEALDVRRLEQSFYTIAKNGWKEAGATDFCSNDILGLGSSAGTIPDHAPGAGGSRLLDGNYSYLEMVENEVAQFHGAEAGMIVGSGYEANGAIFLSIPRPGDAIVYDEFVHASTHDGIQHSSAMVSKSFRHNDVLDFQSVLEALVVEQPLIAQGKRSVLVAVESIYSMDGDLCPLREFVEVAKDIFPRGNCQFVVDEAHSNGVIGPHGKGFVSELGLENEVAIRLHTFGKALGSSGAIILGNKTLKAALVNFGRSIIYTTAPSFITVAGIRSGYNLLKSGKTQAAQDQIQHLVQHFFTLLTAHPVFEIATRRGVFSIPLAIDWESRYIHTHIVPIWIKDRKSYWLFFHLLLARLSVFPVEYPTVPQGAGRVRIVFHGSNTEAQVERLVDAIFEWTEEMLSIKEKGDQGLPSAAQNVYARMAEE